MTKLVLSPEKFILIIDQRPEIPHGNEFRIIKALTDIDQQQRICLEYPEKQYCPTEDQQLPNINLPITANDNATTINILLQPISKLLIFNKPTRIIQLIDQLKKMKSVHQLYSWINVSTIPLDKSFLIKFLEHMANIIITITNDHRLTVLTKKSIGGTISQKVYQYEMKQTEIITREIKGDIKKTKELEPSIDPETLTTFKINFDEEELVARNALKLPYERTNDDLKDKEINIHYQPDSDDDFDEEDPDTDLYI